MIARTGARPCPHSVGHIYTFMHIYMHIHVYIYIYIYSLRSVTSVRGGMDSPSCKYRSCYADLFSPVACSTFGDEHRKLWLKVSKSD